MRRSLNGFVAMYYSSNTIYLADLSSNINYACCCKLLIYIGIHYSARIVRILFHRNDITSKQLVIKYQHILKFRIKSMYGITVQDPDSGPRVSVMSTSRDKDQAEFISHMVQYLLDTKQVHHSI